MADAVVVKDLHKRYGTVWAVRGVSAAVKHGEIFALLGRNGTGKTTTLEILEGFRGRDLGQVDVLGLAPGEKAPSGPVNWNPIGLRPGRRRPVNPH
ncbi:ATP-binding cassette domain-containing protein [Streptomyces sp. NPDC001816]|uniref:ATP-binding cassette domain-containing protein n=1 Tax=Streptomyces sp. NPDC001816 TaxID=3364612 RepID=UPI0036CB7F77